MLSTTTPARGSCAGCSNDLGGGCCRINEESECREGGGFELWTDAGEKTYGAPDARDEGLCKTERGAKV